MNRGIILIMVLSAIGVQQAIGCTCLRGCIDKFNILTVTSTESDAQTDGEHFLEIQANGEARSLEICGRGKKCTAGEVDYFTLDIERFGFSSRCIRKEDFEGAKLKEKSIDGWIVAAVFLFADTCETHELLTADPNFNKWIDGDRTGAREQPLTSL